MPITRLPSVAVGAPQVVHVANTDGIANWDLHPDGRRLVITVPVAPATMAAPGGASAAPRFLLTLNWVDELRRQIEAHWR